MRIKAIIMCFLFSLVLHSQQKEPIQADRPDQTETPAIVPKGMFQVEAGFSVQKIDEKNRFYTLPTALWKYGVNGHLELRLITEFIAEKENNISKAGITPVLIG